jgi:putative pyruvate formate lyase activating enzyme
MELSLNLLAKARQHDRHCLLCEHRCAVDRSHGERGVCRAGTIARVFRHRIEFGEEPELLPCHLFYLSGCDLRCAFCIAEANAFDPSRGRDLTPELFGEAVRWGQSQNVRTLQWVGGEPTIHLPRILEVMSSVKSLPTVVWKSDFYATENALELLDGVVDVYVADFKFGNDVCARRIASVDNYWSVVTRNLRIAAGQGRLIVRHLLLPGHFDCCFVPVVRWLQSELPGAAFSLRDGYLPRWRARSFAELGRCIDKPEATAARRLAAQAGLEVIA